TTWGGNDFAWGSPLIVILTATSVVTAVAFVMVERNAAVPMLPLRLFKLPACRIAAVTAFLIGMAMLTAISFLPLLLQIASGATATRSALVLMPLLVAIPGASIIGGQIITRTGRYKVFPII